MKSTSILRYQKYLRVERIKKLHKAMGLYNKKANDQK